MANLRRLCRPATYVVLAVVGALLEGFSLGLLLPVFDAFGGAEETSTTVAGQRFEFAPGTLVLYICLILGLRSAMAVLTHLTKSVIVNSWAHQSRSDLYRSAHSEVETELQRAKTGSAINILLGETWHSSEYRKTQLDLIARIVSLSVFVSVLLWLTWELTVIVAALFVVPLGVLGGIGSFLARKYGRRIVTYENRIHDETLASLNGRFGIKAYSLEDYFQRTFDRSSSKLRALMVKAEVAGSTVPQLLNLLLLPALLVSMLLANNMGLSNERVALFVVVVVRSMPHIGAIVGATGELGRHRGGHEVVRRHLAAASPHSDVLLSNHDIDLDGRPCDRISTIELFDVGFTYDDAQYATVSNFSTIFEPGRWYELKGRSGSGKSTLLSIILGFNRPTSGWVEINGIPLSEIDVRSFRQQVGYAGQRGTLFEGTIRDNILLGRDVSDNRVDLVAKRLGLTQVFSELPDGADTMVGVSGVEISGGERQRVQVARAILDEPQLLILDEVTSELDLSAEAEVLAAIVGLCPKAIKIFVSHRSTVETQVAQVPEDSVFIKEVAISV